MLNLILVMIIWGSLGIFALWSGLSAFELAYCRCLIGAGILGIYCWKKKYFVIQNFTNRMNIFYVLLSGTVIVLNWVLLFKSFQLASITIGNVSYYLQPVFLVILSIMFFKDIVTLKQWCFILLTTLGVILTSNLKAGGVQFNSNVLMGVLCAVGAGLFYACATILIKYIQKMPEALITFLQLCLGCIILLPFVKFANISHMSTKVIFIVTTIGIVHTAIAFILYYKALSAVNLTLVGILSYIDPIVAIITDVIFCDRSFNNWQILGIILTFIGSYKVIKLKKEGQQNIAVAA